MIAKILEILLHIAIEIHSLKQIISDDQNAFLEEVERRNKKKLRHFFYAKCKQIEIYGEYKMPPHDSFTLGHFTLAM